MARKQVVAGKPSAKKVCKPPAKKGARKGSADRPRPNYAPQEIVVGKERAVVVPLQTWEKLMEELEDFHDILAYDKAKAEMTHENEDDYVEHDEVCRMMGRSPLRYLRGRAGMTQAALARKAGLSQSYIAKIEGNERKVSLTAAKKIARALKLPPEKIIT